MIQHPIPPLYNADSTILILGSFPSVSSRKEQFFYGHPQNRFWKVIAAVFEKETPKTIEEKRALATSCRFALWDVIASCDIQGSADSTIQNVVPNDIGKILQEAEIKRIFVNGKTAEKYYNKLIRHAIGREAVCLPSTSPANATWSLEQLIEAWKIIRE